MGLVGGTNGAVLVFTRGWSKSPRRDVFVCCVGWEDRPLIRGGIDGMGGIGGFAGGVCFWGPGKK